MNLQELNDGTPATKPWLNIKAATVEAKILTAEILNVADVVVEDLSADVVTLNDTGGVPNPPVGAVTFFSTGAELKATNPVGVTLTFATTTDLVDYLLRDGSLPMTGDLDMGNFGITSSGAAGPRFGNSATTGGNSSTAMGNDATASGLGATAVGRFCTASSNNCLAYGISATASAVGAAAFGRSAVASAGDAVAIGTSANASASNAIAIGLSSSNAVANSCSIGGASIGQVRPGNNAGCDLGTAGNQWRDLYLSGVLRGANSARPNYSSYSDTTCDNTVTETPISGAGSALGSLTLAAGQPLGMVLHLNTCITASSVAGDNLDIRFYSNGALLFTHSLTVPALAVNLPIVIKTDATIRGGAIHICSVANMNATFSFVTSSAIVYDRTVANTWSVTAQWGANVNQLTCGQLFMSSMFSG